MPGGAASGRKGKVNKVVRQLVNMGEDAYNDPETLRELYHEKRMTQAQMADRLGCSRQTIIKKMDKFGIEARDVGGSDPAADYRDADTLTELYHGEGLTTYELADRLNTTASTIRYWMEKHGIGRRERWYHDLVSPAPFRVDSNGYEKWVVRSEGKYHRISVHRLAAVAWFGFDAVRDMDVHHRNGIKWDTREDNLELLSHADHARHHANESEFWKHRDNLDDPGGST